MITIKHVLVHWHESFGDNQTLIEDEVLEGPEFLALVRRIQRSKAYEDDLGGYCKLAWSPLCSPTRVGMVGIPQWRMDIDRDTYPKKEILRQLARLEEHLSRETFTLEGIDIFDHIKD